MPYTVLVLANNSGFYLIKMKTAPLQKSVRLLDRFSTRCGQTVSWLVLFLALLTLMVALPRYLLSSEWFLGLELLGLDWEAIRSVYSRNVNAMNDGIQYLHATIFMVGVAYALKLGDHVRIDIFYRSMSLRKRAWVDLLGTLLFLYPMFIFILVMSWEYVLSSWEILEASQRPGGLPLIYLFKTLILIMPVFMLLQGTALLLRNLLVLMGHPMEDTDQERSS